LTTQKDCALAIEICFKSEKMEALKLKIFEVLTEKIAVEEFENWLYNSEEILGNLNSNSFYFDLISINFKDEKWKLELSQIVDTDLWVLSETEKLCREIQATQNLKVCGQLVSELVNLMAGDSFEETEYIIVYNFHSLNSRYDLIKLNYMKSSDFILEAKYYSNILLEKLENFESLNEKIDVLKSNFEDDFFFDKPTKISQNNNSENFKKVSIKSKSVTLNQKIFAFFKKI